MKPSFFYQSVLSMEGAWVSSVEGAWDDEVGAYVSTIASANDEIGAYVSIIVNMCNNFQITFVLYLTLTFRFC